MDSKTRKYLLELARQTNGQGLCPICGENSVDACDSECMSCNIEKFAESMEMAEAGFYDFMDAITDDESRRKEG